MSIDAFSLANVLLLLISICLVSYIIFLWLVIKQNATEAEHDLFNKRVTRFSIVYAVYLLLLCTLAGTGFFNVITTPPRFLLIFVPMLLIVVLLIKGKRNGSLAFLSAIPPVLLIGVHVFRVIIELIFLQFAKDRLIPVELSIHGRNFDLFVGLLAIPVALLFIKKHPVAHKAGIVFNILGLLSLANIFSIAIPSLPSTFRVYDTLYLPTYFPGVLIVFVASMAVYLHVLSLRQLLARTQEAIPAKSSKTVNKAALPSIG